MMTVGGQVTFGKAWIILTLGIFITLTQPLCGIENCIDSSLDKAKGHCANGCKPGFYGLYCNESCPTSCDAACSQRTGNCLTGCDATWFKANCSRNCVGYCTDDICDIKSGECIHGCVSGYYGPSCDQKCSENCTGGVCDEFGGCRCKKGVEDTACYLDCTDNCVDGQCDVDSSGQPTCSKGCLPGRTGHFCQEWCPSNCSQCDSNGICLQETTERHLAKRDLMTPCCTDGWTGNGCNTKCPNCIYSKLCNASCKSGYFGDECHLNCPSNCRKGVHGKPSCTKDLGHCHSGCLQGYYGDTCRDVCSLNCRGRRCFPKNGSCGECEARKYGPKCEDDCLHCNEQQCTRNGTCKSCEHGWYGLRCQFECTVNCQTNICRVDVRGNHVCVGDCVEGYTGDGCLEECPSGCPKSCHRKNGTCPISDVISVTSKNSTLTADSKDQAISDGAIVGAVVGTVAIVAVVVVVVVVIRRRKKIISCQCKRRKEKEIPHERDALDLGKQQQSGEPPESKVERIDESPQHLGGELKVEMPDEKPKHVGDGNINEMHATSKLRPPPSLHRESSVTADRVALDPEDVEEILKDFGKLEEGESHKRNFWSNLGYSEENIPKSSDLDSVYTMLEKAPALYGLEAEQVNYKIILALRFANMVDIADSLIKKHEECLPSQFVDVNRDVTKLKVGYSEHNENISVQGPEHQAVQKETKTGGQLQDDAPFSTKSDDEPADVHKEEEAPLLK